MKHFLSRQEECISGRRPKLIAKIWAPPKMPTKENKRGSSGSWPQGTGPGENLLLWRHVGGPDDPIKNVLIIVLFLISKISSLFLIPLSEIKGDEWFTKTL